MSTLEDGIKNVQSFDLSVAYYCDQSLYEPPFDYEGVHYYPIVYRGGSYFNKLRERLVSSSKEDNRLLGRLINVVRDVNPDIIHVHGTESNFGLIVNEIKDIPIVISLQGVLSPIVERYFAGIPLKVARQCDRIRDYIHQINESKVYADYQYAAIREQQILQNSRFIIGRTDWDRELASMMAPHAKYFVVNEIIREEFRNAQWSKSKPGNKFCIISTLSNGIYKGYELILKAAALLKQYATFDYEWKVIGCDENYKYVKAAIKMTGFLPSEVNVSFIGRKKVEEMIPLMLDSDIYIQTSHIENSPNALCEALTLGMPCLASNVGGTPTILKEGTMGILYPSGDPYALSSTIIRLKNNYEKIIKMTTNAREVSMSRNSVENVVKELAQVYNDILICK